MKEFNLSAWALKHQALILYAMFVLLLSGIFAYSQLAQKEDPDFTFKVMTIKVLWPGATAREVELQVTHQIETKLQETPWLDNVSSYSKAGETVIFVTLKDAMPPTELSHAWAQVRKLLADMQASLPEDVQGPFINDDFGETYGAIYALTSPTLSHAELTQYANAVREHLLKISGINKIVLLGVQEEKIYIEFSSAKMADLGINPLQVATALRAQNAMEPAGEITTHYGVTRLRVSGDFHSLQSIQDIGIHANGKTHRLGNIAHVYRAESDPATFKMHSMGQSAIGLALVMSMQANVSAMGEKLQLDMAKLKRELPSAVHIYQVSDQAKVVKISINEFMQALLEALVIVLLVSFVSLGWRAGMVVGLSIPLVLAGTFMLMRMFDIDLQRVSLGALIIALGLLVDDAMIAVEMMQVKLAQGWSKFNAATFAYRSTAFPMLTGTLITAAAFLPVGLAKSSAGEYTFSICAVVTIALLVSWLVAVIFTPFMGYRLLQDNGSHTPSADHYRQGFYAHFHQWVEICLTYRKSVLGVTIVIFALSLYGFSKVEQEFFPPSERPELLMDVWLPEGASFSMTEGLVTDLENKLKSDPDIANYTSYIGASTPRFYLPLDLQLPSVNFAQLVITARDAKSREAVLQRTRKMLESDYAELGIRVARLENGPPVGYPVQFRVLGADPDELRRIAAEIAQVVRDNKHTKNVSVDSNEKIRTVNIEVNQEKARQFGLSSQAISRNLQALLTGMTITNLREGAQHISIVARTVSEERANPDYLLGMNIYTEDGRFVPLSQLAKISQAEEDGIVWRMNRIPVVTVRADVPDDVKAADISIAIDHKIDAIRAKLPAGYRIELGGVMEDSDKAQDSIIEILPLMGFLIVTLLMLQLKRFKPVLLALLTAPLGIIGVVLALLLFHVPFGFVAMLGMISLAGMIMRNSVILLDQISQDIAAGMSHWDAIVESTVRRFRPIMLTAAAAILAMIPLTQSVFWGPMAVVIMGGLLVATLLTLFYLPALYAIGYQVKRPSLN